MPTTHMVCSGEYTGTSRNSGILPVEIPCGPRWPVESTFLRSLEEKNGFKKKVFWFSSKIHDKRCFNVQRHHPNQQISPTRPENVPKYKGFCIDFRSSRRHSMIIWCLCTLKHRLSWFFDENQKTFFKIHSFHPKITKTCSPRVSTGGKPISRGNVTGSRGSPGDSGERPI